MRTSIFIVGLIFMASCNGCKESNHNQQLSYDQIQEQLIQANRTKVREEREEIDAFIAEKEWPMQESPTGLRYWVYEKYDQPLAKNEMLATISYEVTLLDGTPCYSSEQDGPMNFIIGRDYIESGIHEGILHMGTGDRARFILPSHLAHGFTGDQDQIPQNAIVMYDIQLIRLD